MLPPPPIALRPLLKKSSGIPYLKTLALHRNKLNADVKQKGKKGKRKKERKLKQHKTLLEGKTDIGEGILIKMCTMYTPDKA